MPQQELFFEKREGNKRIEVIKTYDRAYAREAFVAMGEAARNHLWSWLEIDGNYEREEIPERATSDGEDFLWQELLEASREDGNELSFFVVAEDAGGPPQNLYVSPDWPSAEAFANKRLAREI